MASNIQGTRPVIVVQLMGGLGNQMFQYALGRRLAYERGVELKLDLSWFEDFPYMTEDTVREYALDGWKITGVKASKAELAQFPLSPTLVHRIWRRLPWFASQVITERSFRFDARVLKAHRTAYLRGYWQSPKYFAPIKDLLRKEFTMHAPPCPHAVSIDEEVRKSGAISVHIRRGDYVGNPVTNAYHGVCSMDYYQNAASLLSAEVAEPRFVVFSDDPIWARENFKLIWPASFVEHDAECSPHNDMWLMSQCSHHIIANSSFSWWGAWLGQNPQRKVVAPARWLQQSDIDTSDLLPKEWVCL